MLELTFCLALESSGSCGSSKSFEDLPESCLRADRKEVIS